jgi:hypothetical protein
MPATQAAQPKLSKMAPSTAVPTYSRAVRARRHDAPRSRAWRPPRRRAIPKPIIDKLNAAVRKALDDAQLRAALLTRGAEPVPSSLAELSRHVASEVARWGKVVHRAAYAKSFSSLIGSSRTRMPVAW